MHITGLIKLLSIKEVYFIPLLIIKFFKLIYCKLEQFENIYSILVTEEKSKWITPMNLMWNN